MVEFFVTYQKEAKFYLFEYYYNVYDDQWKKPFHQEIPVGSYILEKGLRS